MRASQLSGISYRLSAGSTRFIAGFLSLFLCSIVAHAQQPRPADTPQEYQIQLEPPGPQRAFRLESEKALFERIRQEARDRNDPSGAVFPQEQVPGEGQTYQPGRPWAATTTLLVPYLVCYNPLYFEEKNTERYGWDWSIFQPIVSTGAFYADVVILPYNFGVMPCWECECNSGYPLIGEPVAYHFYLPPFSWKGAALQAAVVGGGVAALP
jgi:hypothetical protein